MIYKNSSEFSWLQFRRYNSYAEYFKQIFGERVQKISVDAGFTCPNRDGTKGHGGCTFCSNDAFNPSYCHPAKPIELQIEEGIEFHRKRYRRASKYLVYFQAYSNTYKPLDQLKQLYELALSQPSVVGLVIGTRPDTINPEIIDYLKYLQQKHYIMLEYGVESVHDKTLERINRGHTLQESVDAIRLSSEAGIPCGAHFIFGLPGETRAQMLETASIVADLPLTTVKFHQLQLFKNTAMAASFNENPHDFSLFGLDEYIEFIIDFIELLNPSFVIERFAGEVPPRFLNLPLWGSLRYDQILKKIENRLEVRQTWQGRLYRTHKKMD